jgi:hypothetical protein
MSKLFQVEINLCATAYIKAEDEAEAKQIAARDLVNEVLELGDRYQPAGDNICIDGRAFACLVDNEEDIALSPVMTITGCGEVAPDYEELDP